MPYALQIRQPRITIQLRPIQTTRDAAQESVARRRASLRGVSRAMLIFAWFRLLDYKTMIAMMGTNYHEVIITTLLLLLFHEI